MRLRTLTEDVTNSEDEIVALYYRDIAKYRPLKAAEEAQLAKKIKEGNRVALNRLVTSNLRFVVSVARNYKAQGVKLIDLINIGNIGLIKAAMRFDEKKNFKFISYAVWWIRQSILQALADQSRLFKVPLNRVSDIYKVHKTIDQLLQRYHRYPQNEEIAVTCGIDKESVNSTQFITQSHVSLDASVGIDSDLPISALIEDKKCELPDTDLVVQSFRKRVIESLDFLEKREKTIIILYFGLNGEEAYTLDEIGKRFNITRERVRQLRDKAFKKLNGNKNFKILYREYFRS